MRMLVYLWVGIVHAHGDDDDDDEERRSANVSHVNRVDDEGYGFARFHVSHVVPHMTSRDGTVSGASAISMWGRVADPI